jgi:hypothetical protein
LIALVELTKAKASIISESKAIELGGAFLKAFHPF